MKHISRTRKRLDRILKDQPSNVLWYLCGLSTLPILGVLASLVLKIPDKVIGVLLPLLFLLILILSTWLILLLDKYAQIKRFIDKEHPNINLDYLEEAESAFKEDP